MTSEDRKASRVLSDWELWACASHMIEKHGGDAPVRAALRCDELLEAGDGDGAATWLMILNRIERLLGAPTGQAH